MRNMKIHVRTTNANDVISNLHDVIGCHPTSAVEVVFSETIVKRQVGITAQSEHGGCNVKG